MLIYEHIQKSPTLGRKPTNAEFMLPKMANLLCVHCVHIVSSVETDQHWGKKTTNAELDSYK